MTNASTAVPRAGRHDGPDLAGLKAAVAAFASMTRASATSLPGPAELGLDLAVPEARRALLRWLNSWGCRLRYAQPGETDLFDTGVRDWSARWAEALVEPRATMAELTDEQVLVVGECYADLSGLPVGVPGRPRSLGPTAASKLLHGLRPAAFMPWDEEIAGRLHGARDAAAFMAHQRLGRTWARQLLAETGLDEPALCAALGRPGRPLAKLLDDYCYIRFTRGVLV